VRSTLPFGLTSAQNIKDGIVLTCFHPLEGRSSSPPLAPPLRIPRAPEYDDPFGERVSVTM